MNREYEKEVNARLKELKPKMRVGSLGQFCDGNKDYEIPYVISEEKRSCQKRVFLSAGIHGDEVAGVYALLDFLKNDAHQYLGRYGFVALPCLNPSGLERDTRHNHSNYDINRDFRQRSKTVEARLVKRFLRKLNERYTFCLTAHEDPTDGDSDGFAPDEIPDAFYLYLVSPNRRLGHTIRRKIRKGGFPVCELKQIYGDRARKGIVYWKGSNDPKYKDDDNLEKYLLNYTDHTITPETPTCWPLEKRIEAHKLTINTSLDYSAGF